MVSGMEKRAAKTTGPKEQKRTVEIAGHTYEVRPIDNPVPILLVARKLEAGQATKIFDVLELLLTPESYVELEGRMAAGEVTIDGLTAAIKGLITTAAERPT